MSLLERAKLIAGDSSPKPWRKEDLTGFFQRFRPFGRGVEQLFCGVVRGDEIYARLVEIYQATADSCMPTDWYFTVRQAPTTSPNQAIDLAKAHFAKMAQIAEIQGEALLRKSISEIIFGVCSPATDPGNTEKYEDSLEAYVDDVKTNFITSLVCDPSEATQLKEGFYSIANDAYLRDFIMWPLYAAHSRLVDPFRPFSELWKRGIKWRFGKDNQITLVLLQN